MPKTPCIAEVLWIALLLLASGSFPAGRASAQTGGAATAPAQNQNQFQLKVRSNLVVVRVVVRDGQGKPIGDLQKEDFKVFDKGKEQSISQFEVEASAQPAAGVESGSSHKSTASAAPSANFLALFFDDLHTTPSDMAYAGDAADKYLTANLQPNQRVAIFASGKMLSDFTADPKQIHEALSKLHARGQSPLENATDCPELSDYQATRILDESSDYSDVWIAAKDEGIHRCHLPDPDNPPPNMTKEEAEQMLEGRIYGVAQAVAEQAEFLARSNLQELEKIVEYVSRMPGQRTILFVSPGFMSQSQQYQLDRVMDRALRSQVVISSLDPRGLAVLLREADATISRSYLATGSVQASVYRNDSSREITATTVMSELASGTGGEYFHDNNDLKAGFTAVAGSPVYYLLAFAPTDMKDDGKFHSLKVTLAEKHKGFSVQARRGYFAPRSEAEAEAEAKRDAASDVEAHAQEQIREAVFSKTDRQQLPIALDAKLSTTKNDLRALSLFGHLDAKTLHFRKEGEHNVNTVTFVFAIFDQKENLLASQRRSARVNVLDGQLPGFFKVGIEADMTFQLKPGIYRIREVVADSEDQHMTALSKMIKIP